MPAGYQFIVSDFDLSKKIFSEKSKPSATRGRRVTGQIKTAGQLAEENTPNSPPYLRHRW
jgi:hypothetical protein